MIYRISQNQTTGYKHSMGYRQPLAYSRCRDSSIGWQLIFVLLPLAYSFICDAAIGCRLMFVMLQYYWLAADNCAAARLAADHCYAAIGWQPMFGMLLLAGR